VELQFDFILPVSEVASSGLPDFPWYIISKQGIIYKMDKQYATHFNCNPLAGLPDLP
jgi:hypothetical protein